MEYRPGLLSALLGRMSLTYAHGAQHFLGPKDHLNTRISCSDPDAQYKGGCQKPGFGTIFLYVVCWGPILPQPHHYPQPPDGLCFFVTGVCVRVVLGSMIRAQRSSTRLATPQDTPLPPSNKDHKLWTP